MLLRRSVAAVLLLAAAQMAVRPLGAAELESRLVVLMSRHGIRSPNSTSPPLADLTADPWPVWPVPPGFLTPRGREAATKLGAFYRATFSARGLLPQRGCPQRGEVYVWSDVEERTRLTAQAMLDGMFPGCGLRPQHLADLEADDPLFHPVDAGVCKIDPQAATSVVMGRIGGSFAPMMSAYSAQFATLQAALQCCAPKLCRAQGQNPRCTLAELAPVMSPASGKLTGPTAIASTVAEVFLLEYADGMPAQQVAWGRLRPEALRDVLRLHTLQFDLMERTPYLAGRGGSNLVAQVLATLRSAATGKAVAGTKAPAGSKVVLMVGHDTNIANIGGLLDLDWALDGYQANQTPPGGAIGFELLRDRRSGQYFVQPFYYAQTPEQLRELATLGLEHPPAKAVMAIPGCAAAAAAGGSGMACPLPVFERIAAAAIDQECVR